MRTQFSFVAVVLIALCHCFGGGLEFSFLSETLAQDSPRADATTKDAAAGTDTSDKIVVMGVALKPDRSPAAGATIRSAVPVPAMVEAKLGRKFVSKIHEATADADGRFTITISKAPYDQFPESEPIWQTLWKSTPIVALLGDFGPAHAEVDEIEEGKPIRLRMVEDLPIRGQVVDLEGQPVRGTRVSIGEVQMLYDNDPYPMLQALRNTAGNQVFQLAPHFQKQWGLLPVERRLIGLPENVVTDEKGSFEIRGLGKDRVIHFALEGGDVAYQTITAISREMEPIQPESRMPARTPQLVYGSKFQVAVSPSRAIEGIVVDAETEKPLAGVSIEMERPRSSGLARRMAMHTGRPVTVMKAVSDETGHFRLTGTAKTGGNSLLVFPPDDQPYFHRAIEVRDEPGADPIKLTIKLHKGIWVKGRITDKDSKKPIVGAHVHYYPFRNNDFASHVSNFKREGLMDSDLDRFKTDADGSYRLIGLSGPGIVGAISGFRPYRTGVGLDQLTVGKDDRMDRQSIWYPMPFMELREHNALRKINPSADGQEAVVDLEFDQGVSVAIQLLDSEGAPVMDVTVFGPGVRQPANPSVIGNNGTITVENLGPDNRPVLNAYHFDRNLGLKFQLEPPYEQGRELKFVLEPMAIVVGRLFEEGAPMRGVSIRRNLMEPTGGMVSLQMPPPVFTDQEGRFRCPIIPGHEYRLTAQGRAIRRPMSAIAEKLTVRAGETVDLGDLEFDDGRFRPLKTTKPEKPDEKNESK